MSWSVHKVGFAGAVAAALVEDFKKIKCNEPEETIKNNVAAAVITAVEAYPSDQVVDVAAGGSQSQQSDGVMNSLSVVIKPLYNFVK